MWGEMTTVGDFAEARKKKRTYEDILNDSVLNQWPEQKVQKEQRWLSSL